MFKKIILLTLMCSFFISASYGYSKQFSEELKKKNQEILEATEGMSNRERKNYLQKKQYEYQTQMLQKQQEIYFLRKGKNTPGYQERKQKVKDLEEEIKELDRAQRNLR